MQMQNIDVGPQIDEENGENIVMEDGMMHINLSGRGSGGMVHKKSFTTIGVKPEQPSDKLMQSV
jgi:hypothetical protein